MPDDASDAAERDELLRAIPALMADDNVPIYRPEPLPGVYPPSRFNAGGRAT